MRLIQELEREIATKAKTTSLEEKERIAVDFLSKVNFKDSSVRVQAIQHIQHLLRDKVEVNEALTSLDAKILHCLYVKMALSNAGLEDTPIHYRDKTVEDKNAEAYYYSGDKSLNFFNQSVCDQVYWLKPYCKDVKKSAQSRYNYLARQVFVVEHEIQHILQYKEIEEHKTQITPRTYIMVQQIVARDLSSTKGTKYFDESLDADRLYDKNHDQFYYEIEADKFGIERTLKVLKSLSPLAYEIAIDEKQNSYVKNLSAKKHDLEHYCDEITWKHDTNPEDKQVLATHKASMIIGTVLPKLSSKQRKEYFETYPSLAIVFNEDGTRKTLDQVEQEKQNKINQLLINGTDRDVQQNATNIATIYDLAIESDAVLCFEKCLQHITRLTWDSDRYFTNNGIEVKYNPSEIRKELSEATKKAKLIAGYIEDADAKKIKAVFTKYRKERNDKITNMLNQRFYEDKVRALSEIEQEFYYNKEAKRTIKEDEERIKKNREKKKMEKNKALEIIQTLFPKFDPNPHPYYILNEGEISNNVDELLMLMEAYKEYVKTIVRDSENIKTQADFLPAGELRKAIETLYDFEPTPEQLAQFQRDLKDGKIQVVNNKYMPMAEQLNTQQSNYGVATQPKIEPQVARQQPRSQRVSREHDYTTDRHQGLGMSR